MAWTSAQRRQLENTLIEHMALFGYDLIDIPHIEAADIFLTRAGDKIIDRLFTFERYGKLLALRPEFTAAAAHRYVLENRRDTVRWQFSGTIFEDAPERPDHNYQRRSMGAELIGMAGSSAEAEVMALTALGAQRAGLERWQLVSGHVGLQGYLLSRFNLDPRTVRLLLAQRDALLNPAQGMAYAIEQIERVLPEYSTQATIDGHSTQADAQTEQMLDVLLDSTQYGTTMGGRSRTDIAQRLLQKRERTLERQQIHAALAFLAEWISLEGSADVVFRELRKLIGDVDMQAEEWLQGWQVTLDRLESYDIPTSRVTIQPNLARNWEYYTGVVFGLRAPDGTLVAGGGRYDELMRLIGGKRATPAVGFAYYMNELMAQLPLTTPKIAALRVPDSDFGRRIATVLRAYSIPSITVPEASDVETDLQITHDGVRYAKHTYTFDDIEQLVQHIKATNA